MVHLEETFNIIKEQHVKKGCRIKSDRTWHKLKDTYANIPKTLTAKYVAICPICVTYFKIICYMYCTSPCSLVNDIFLKLVQGCVVTRF